MEDLFEWIGSFFGTFLFMCIGLCPQNDEGCPGSKRDLKGEEDPDIRKEGPGGTVTYDKNWSDKNE